MKIARQTHTETNTTFDAITVISRNKYRDQKPWNFEECNDYSNELLITFEQSRRPYRFVLHFGFAWDSMAFLYRETHSASAKRQLACARARSLGRLLTHSHTHLCSYVRTTHACIQISWVCREKFSIFYCVYLIIFILCFIVDLRQNAIKTYFTFDCSGFFVGLSLVRVCVRARACVRIYSMVFSFSWKTLKWSV